VTDIRDDVEALSARLRADLDGVSRRIDEAQQQVLDSWPAARAAGRRRLLASLQTRVAALAAQAGELALAQVAEIVSGAWQLGGAGMALTAGRTAGFGATDVAAITHLAADTYQEVLAATTHIRSDTKELVRVLGRDRVADALVTGQGTAPAARALARDLAGHSITAVTYVDGSRHRLGDYSDMLLRTKTAEAHQLGGFAQARTVGIEWVEILDGPGCGLTSHRDARKANGLILELGEAEQWPLSHPRCRRVTTGRPDIRSPEQALGAEPVGPRFSAADIEAGHHDPSRTTVALATVRTAKTGALSTSGVAKAVRSHQAKTAARRA
jgi:hypothetical protein